MTPDWEFKRLKDKDGTPYSSLQEYHVTVGPFAIWCPPGDEEREKLALMVERAPELLRLAKTAILESPIYLGNHWIAREIEKIL